MSPLQPWPPPGPTAPGPGHKVTYFYQRNHEALEGISVRRSAHHTSWQGQQGPWGQRSARGVVLPDPAYLTPKWMSFMYDICHILYILQIRIFNSVWGGRVDCWKFFSKISDPSVYPV